MSYELIATLIATLHLTVLLLDMIGAVWVMHVGMHVSPLRWWQRAYLTVVVLKSVSLLVVDGCPLTLLERWVRRLGSTGGYTGSFLQHYLPTLPSAADRAGTILLMLVGLLGLLQAATGRRWLWKADIRLNAVPEAEACPPWYPGDPLSSAT